MDKNKLNSIFLPTMSTALDRVEKNNLKLAHYTRFDVAKLIITGRSVWMRNARQMNDVGEIAYGIAAIDYAMEQNQQLLNSVLSPIHPLLTSHVQNAWIHLRSNVTKDVFITCVSEHWPSEDPFGRLSMWRAYGTPDGVAIVMNVEPFRLESNGLNAYSSPVFYGDKEQVSVMLKQVLNNIGDSQAELKASIPIDLTLNLIATALLFGAVCLKHPAFAEEQEWRVIHMPNIEHPSLLRRLDIPGPPAQTVFQIPLADSPEHGLIGLTPDALIHRMIVGPSNRAEEIAAELAILLAAQGVQQPETRISKSGIPLRV